MKDSSLLRTALVLGFFGLIALYFISKTVLPELEERPLAAVEDSSVVRLTGIVAGVEKRGEILIVELEKTVDIVFFDSVAVHEGSYVEIIGEVETYEGKKEVIGRLISHK